MPLHLIKLAVGCDSVKELKGWVAERMQTARKKGLPQHHIHITRMTPKRDAEILAGLRKTDTHLTTFGGSPRVVRKRHRGTTKFDTA